MERLFLTVFIGLLLTAMLHAADEQILKSNWLIGGSCFFQHLGYKGGGKNTNIQVYPKGGLFVADNPVIGLLATIDVDTSKDNDPDSTDLNTDNLSVRPFIGYYFPLTTRLRLFAEGYFTYGWQFYKPSFTNNNYHLYQWWLEPGIAFFLSGMVSFASIGCGQTGSVEKEDRQSSELPQGSLIFNLALVFIYQRATSLKTGHLNHA